jgi:hypothetical protein
MFHGSLFQPETVTRGTRIFVEIYSMPARNKIPKSEETAALLKFREKRKWQITFRRYVLEENPAVQYAPYFGLDTKTIRQWFEMQFTNGLSWENFASAWQFDHIIPVTYFDFRNEQELRLCWNFTNIRVKPVLRNKDRGNRVDVLMAKQYFEELYTKTGYKICKLLLEKINTIEISDIISTESQKEFILFHKDYLEHIESFSFYEFELLNSGRDIQEVKKEAEMIKSLSQ